MTSDIGHRTFAACATATGDHSALLRLSGPDAIVIAQRAGVPLPAAAWRVRTGDWTLAEGCCPCRVLLARAPRSFTGCDLVEVVIPGARDLVELALSVLLAAGAQPAAPGAFARQALANGRLSLDRAEAILALTQAPTAAAAAQALERLRGAFGDDLATVRGRLLHARALVEAGLDFVDEADVRAYDPGWLHGELVALREVLTRWRSTADALEGEPRVCLVGRANAGKSALFNRLTGGAALVSPVAGTTRDWLDAPWDAAGRQLRLIDTAGWLDAANGLDAAGIQAGRDILAGAALILACSAPDAPLPDSLALPISVPVVVLATKADLGPPDPRATLAVSVVTDDGMAQVAGLVTTRLGAVGGGEPRQQRLLAEADAVLARLTKHLPADELLADDLRLAADRLGELIGATTADEVLSAIFARFCIGK